MKMKSILVARAFSQRLSKGVHRNVYSWSKPEGDISSVFASLSGDEMNRPLDKRFEKLKEELIRGHENEVERSWTRLLSSLKSEISSMDRLKASIIPQFNLNQLSDLSDDQRETIRKRGVVLIRSVLKMEDSLDLKARTQEYIKKNPQSKGFPSTNPVVYELYWSPTQVEARCHPNVVRAMDFVNGLWKSSPTSEVLWDEHLIYADRLRIRQAGDKFFALGPHVDGGSIERWENPNYRSVYQKIFQGCWEDVDLFDGTHRIDANMSMYNTVGGCSIFRSWQGWLSLSAVEPGHGGLKVNPLLKQVTSYWILRPFFKRFNGKDPWILDRSSVWQGAIPGRGQEINETFHPDLNLSKSMISIPEVRPGDMLFWHCDSIHSVDAEHRGQSDSSVFYIPAVPLCRLNVEYLRGQRQAFLDGLPPPDFPGGQGESKHIGRATIDDLRRLNGTKPMGFDKFSSRTNRNDIEKRVLSQANSILGFE